MKNYFSRTLFSLIFLSVIGNAYSANGTVILSDDMEYSVWRNIDIFEDKTATVTINDILDNPSQIEFFPAGSRIPNFGYTKSAYWVRFEVHNKSRKINKWISESKYINLNYVDFYLIDNQNGQIIKTVKTGNMRPLETRDYFHQKIVFILPLEAEKNYTVYLRIKNTPSISLPLAICSFRQFEKKALQNNIFIGIILGILLLLIISNANVIVALKDRSYLYFSLFLFSILMFNLTYSGLAYLYLWPDFFTWNLYANPIFVSFIVLFFLKFTQKFLQYDKENLFWKNITATLTIIWLLIIILIPILSYQLMMKIILIFLVFSISLTLWLGYRSYLDNYHPAKMFLASMALIILTAINLSLIRLGILPPWDFGENGYMIGIVFLSWLMSRALTDRIKVLQNEKENASVKLIKSTEKYRNIFENITDIYFEIDLEGNIIEVSPSAYNLFKYDRQYIINKNLSDLYSDLKDTDAFISFISQKGYIKNYSLKLKDKNDVPHYVSINAILIRDDKQQPLKIAGVIRDETENKKLQEQLFQAQKMESMGRLAAGIAHDFNNLLTVIKGYSELALNKLNPGEPVYKDIVTIQSAGDKAENLTRQILAFSRKQSFQPQIIDINFTITNLDKMMRRIIGEDIDFHLSLKPDLPKIKADPGQIEQIIFNILVNAKDALAAKTEKASEKKITIETGLSKLGVKPLAIDDRQDEEYYLFFSISDNGIGIPEDIRQNIFDPFFTTKEKGKGTGLGLSTVYGIVTQNKGKITVYSEEGRGTVFKIYWPVPEEEKIIENREPISEVNLRGTETLLLVEDDENVRNFTSLALKNFGYTVYTAENGMEALDIINNDNQHFDLVITDLVMPEMGGSEMAGHLQKDNPEIKILCVSGYSGEHNKHSGKLDENINFLHKPYSISELAAKVREILNNDI